MKMMLQFAAKQMALPFIITIRQDRRLCVHFSYSVCFFFSSRRRHTRYWRDWSSDVCSSDLEIESEWRGAAPFGLDLVEEGKIRVIARGSEIKARTDQTVRVCMANAQVLGKRGDAVARFMQGYRDALDWMYADPAALQMYEAFSNVRHELMAKVRDQNFPKATLWPDEVRGLDLVLSDALKNRFTARPLTPAEVKEMIQIPAPL